MTFVRAHRPGLVESTRFVGQVIVGFCLSSTVTVNEQLPPFVVMQLTVVVPTGKKEPLVAVQVTGPQLLLAVGAAKFTMVPHWPAVFVTTMFVGQVSAQPLGLHLPA